MTVNPEEIVETRELTPEELAGFIKDVRQRQGWSQATLAEIAGLAERTIQRVESGRKPSSDVHTRRALARAFGFEDLDFFEKPHPMPNPEKWKAYEAQLDKTTAVVPLTRIRDGRTLRMMAEGALACAADEIGEISPAARQAFAAMVDYLRDYNDVDDLYSMTQRIEVDRDIDAFLKTISDEHAAVGAGLRHARVRLKPNAPDCEPMDWTNIYFVLAPDKILPSLVRVPKKFSLA